MLVTGLAVLALAANLAVVLLPSRPWSTRERLGRADSSGVLPEAAELGSVSVLIPARNEAESIAATLGALSRQGRNLHVVVVDDQSTDDTAGAARLGHAGSGGRFELEIVAGTELPDGWGGKLWALEQGLGRTERDFCLLLDAEIELAPGVLGRLLEKARDERLAMVSIMAELRCETFWEKLLVPPFIYFFKLIYPFGRANDPASRTAAAAGGCILIRTQVLREIGGFAAIRDALIDDCTLAGRVKAAGNRIWIGLSHEVRSLRRYSDLASFRHMVRRTAFTQLRYSFVLLLLVTGLMLLVYVLPWTLAIVGPRQPDRVLGLAAIMLMALAYWPTVRFYGLSPLRSLSLAAAAVLFLGMTIESALRYARGTRADWKGRTYSARP